jgi:DNA invertase Pin-like site-specific DNA recombinase
MRVGLYARVSTVNGQSPEMQLVELREYASRRGWEIAANMWIWAFPVQKNLVRN